MFIAVPEAMAVLGVILTLPSLSMLRYTVSSDPFPLTNTLLYQSTLDFKDTLLAIIYSLPAVKVLFIYPDSLMTFKLSLPNLTKCRFKPY